MYKKRVGSCSNHRLFLNQNLLNSNGIDKWGKGKKQIQGKEGIKDAPRGLQKKKIPSMCDGKKWREGQISLLHFLDVRAPKFDIKLVFIYLNESSSAFVTNPIR